MEGHVNTYGGMNKDMAYDSIKPNLYIDALNIRISTDKGESNGAFTNIKGNELSFTIPTSGTFDNDPPNLPLNWTTDVPEIIGYGTIRDTIVLFVADNTGTKGWIYKVEYNPATREVVGGAATLLYYNDNLNFKKEWPIEALGRYENAAVQKVYWTDYNNIFRTINIADPNLNTFNVDNIDIYPSISFNLPLLKAIIGGGALKTGQYQIAYRLITSDGKETLISPPSNMIPIYTTNIVDQYPIIIGDPLPAVDSGKIINIEVTIPDFEKFEQIEFFALYYESPTATPLATSIEIQTLTSSLVKLTYSGNEGSIFDIELFTLADKST